MRQHDVVFDSGGSCANTVATVGRLGGRARYCGQVGDDQMGQLYGSLLEKSCGGHALQFHPSHPTGKCLSIISAADAERTMLTDLGAAVGLTDLGEFTADLQRTRIAHFTGYTLLDGPMSDVILQAMQLAADGGARVSVDAADPFVVNLIRDRLGQTTERLADVLFLNADEAEAMTGSADPEVAARRLGEGVAIVAVKLGKRGSLVVDQGQLHEIGVFPVDAVDTTGAGDAYAGGFLYALARGWSTPRAGALASAVAGLAVSQIGAVVHDVAALRRIQADLEAA